MKPRRGSRRARSDRCRHDDADDAGTAAARERVRAVLDGVTRINLGVVVVAPPDATRMAARDVARAAASVAGRGPLLGEALAATREVVLDSFARSGFSGTWAATEMSMSVAGPADRMAAAAAFEEATMAAVVEDLDVDEETLDVLRSTSLELTGLGRVAGARFAVLDRLAAAGVFGARSRSPSWARSSSPAPSPASPSGRRPGSSLVFIGVGIVAALARRESRPIP